MTNKIIQKKEQPSHNLHSIVTDVVTGENVCVKCGFVTSDRIEDRGPEWRSFTQDEHEDRARAGAPTSLTMHDMGLATVINPINKDASGKSLSPPMKTTIYRLRLWDNRSKFQKSIERNYRQAFYELWKMKDKLALSDSIIEKAAYIYRKAINRGLVQGRSISALLASSLYAACREADTPRTLKDFEEVTDIRKRVLASFYRLLVTELELKMPVMDAVNCVSRIASKIGLSEKTKRFAIEILRKAEQNEISSGKDPMGLAATALYLSCVKIGENQSQKKIAEAANVTEVTIRNRLKDLIKLLKN